MREDTPLLPFRVLDSNAETEFEHPPLPVSETWLIIMLLIQVYLYPLSLPSTMEGNQHD